MKKCETIEARSGFSLIEVTLAMTIASLALLSLIGLLPHSMKFERESADLTAIGTIIEDIHDRLEGQPLEKGVPSISPVFYDMRGRYWSRGVSENSPDASPLLSRRFFRADIELVESGNSSTSSIPPFAVRINFSWPLDDEGNPIGDKKPNSSVTYYTTALTGPDWGEIDPDYQTKIEY